MPLVHRPDSGRMDQNLTSKRCHAMVELLSAIFLVLSVNYDVIISFEFFSLCFISDAKTMLIVRKVIVSSDSHIGRTRSA